MSENTEKLLLIAKIVAVQGIKGQVRVDFYSESPENIKKYKQFFLKTGEQVQIKPDFFKKNQIIATVNGIKDRNEAEKLIGKEIFVQKAALAKLKPNEFYINDLDGLKVVNDSNGDEIGIVHAVHNFGAGNIIEVKYSNREKHKYEMFAFNDDNFPKVDLENGVIVLSQPITEEIEL